MSKPVRSEAELIEMARAGGIEGACGPAGWHHHLDPARWRQLAIPRPGRQGDRGQAGYPEAVAMLVQIGDHLSKQYDVKG